MSRIDLDGKQFAVEGDRFPFRGVTYGTFRPRGDGARFPGPEQVQRDFVTMRDHGFTVVRTYTTPPDDVIALAGTHDLRILTDVFYPDWRYLVGSSRREQRVMVRRARETVRDTARRLAGDERVLALSLGNEIPADVIRWFGTDRIAAFLADLGGIVREEDPDRLVTYANYPTAEYLPLETLDFLTFNVFLERRSDLRRYLTRLHHLAGDRPLVLGEIGLHAGEDEDGEKRQADAVDWQLEVALERGVAGTCLFSWTDEWWVGDAPVEHWRFGLTRTDRSPRPALDVAAGWNQRTVADLPSRWPSISVVICAYNAERTLDECLTHTCSLDYPGLEIIVVDDGSIDDTTTIARRHPRVRLVELPHGGLSVARNAGYEAASGEIVAYLDSDAYPTPEWPYYLAIGFDAPMVGGVGGPNVPPPDDEPGAHMVARAPGGPVHVLVSDDRAEHIPGCNMAFWRDEVLTEIGGFDPIYDAAGDDVDMCWRVLDGGWEIGFHPAALVWHHRRAGARAYFRQQRGYGRAEALVEARHPDRFNALGNARWRGRIYDSFAPSLARQRVYRGPFGTAAYQSVYRDGGHAADVAHQVGVPAAIAALLTAPLALVDPRLGVFALLALAFLSGLTAMDAARANPPRHLDTSAVRFRLGVAWLHLLQPVVRLWGRLRHVAEARRSAPRNGPVPGPARRMRDGTLVLPDDRPRAATADSIVGVLLRRGLRVIRSSGWEAHDAEILGSPFVRGQLLTSAYPLGCTQVRIRLRPHVGRTFAAGVMIVAVVAVGAPLWFAAALGAGLALEGLRGALRAGPFARRAIVEAAGSR